MSRTSFSVPFWGDVVLLLYSLTALYEVTRWTLSLPGYWPLLTFPSMLGLDAYYVWLVVQHWRQGRRFF